MFNIATTKNNETKFYEDADGKPRQYPTLADALVTAQYHGLTHDADGLHFVRDGVSIEAFTKTTTSPAPAENQSSPAPAENQSSQTPRVTTNRGAEPPQANSENNAQQT